MSTKNICLGCNGPIKTDYKPNNWKPSARIICDRCIKLTESVDAEAQHNEFVKNFPARFELVLIIITDHHCQECGFVGEASSVLNKVFCPVCKTINDVWFNEKHPENHIMQIESNVRKNERSKDPSPSNSLNDRI